MPDKVVALVPSVVDNDVRISSPEVSKQLVQRRSCELVNTPSPCVKKALFHLERIKVSEISFDDDVLMFLIALAQNLQYF